MQVGPQRHILQGNCHPQFGAYGIKIYTHICVICFKTKNVYTSHSAASFPDPQGSRLLSGNACMSAAFSLVYGRCVAMWLFVYLAPHLWTFVYFLSSCPHKERSESVSVYLPLHASVRTFQSRLPDVEMLCGLVQLDFVGQDLAVQPRLTHSSQRRLTLNSCWGHRLAVLRLANTDYFR